LAELLYSVTMSLDGFIAGPGGDMSWLTSHLGPNPDADALVDEIGALLVGRRTFAGDDPHKGVEGKEGEPFGGGWSGLQVVLTRSPPAPGDGPPDVRFESDVREAVRIAAAAADARGRRWVNVLGAQTARSCLDAGLLDEVLVFVAPALLGDGTRLFDRPGGDHVRLERVAVSAAAPLATMLRYRVVR
jgi:riboflavin biosynthesis pyrimidine reductase